MINSPKLKMNLHVAKNLLLIGILALSQAASAQPNPVRRTVSLPNDILTLKRWADGGDFQAQIALANKLSAAQRPADALMWYRKASATGAAEADYQIGRMLLYGAVNDAAADQKVLPKPVEGVRWAFRAATNYHADACRDLSGAFQRGLGVEKNLVEAYAWMHLFADANPAVGRAGLDGLTLLMTTSDVDAGRRLAKQFQSRQWPKWPKLTMAAAPQIPLRLNGVTAGGNAPLAVVNRCTLAQGESAAIPLNGRMIAVKCVEVRHDSVLIEVEGESEPRWLRFDSAHLANSTQR
jgi:hypothetical protein